MQKLIWENAKGERINLTAGDFGITEWEGFSNAPLNIQSQKIPLKDGSVYLDSLMGEKELSVKLAINDNNDLEKRYRLRRELISKLNPKLGEGYLIYSNNFISKRIKCIPQIPIFENHNSNDTGTPKASLVWTACEPYWEDVEETEVILKSFENKSIVNEGDVPCQVKIEADTWNSNSFSIKNGDKTISLRDINESDKIFINTEVGNKQVISEELKFNLRNCSPDFLTSICYSEKLDLFVAVGDSGTIITNKDKINWENVKIDNDFSTTMRCIIYAEKPGLFVAVGSSGTILTSKNGINWTQQTSGITNALHSVCYSEELDLFMAVGSSGTILTSSDCVTWNYNSYSSPTLLSVCYIPYDLGNGSSQFIAVGSSGVILYSYDGVAWDDYELGSDDYYTDVCYSKELGLIVIVGGDKTITISSDGQTFENIQFEEDSSSIMSVCYAETLNLFIAVGINGLCYTSTDGRNWTERYLGEKVNAGSIIYVEKYGEFFITNQYYGGGSGVCYIMSISNIEQLYSELNLSWKNVRMSDTNYYCRGCAYSKKLDLFVAINQYRITTSHDGINWKLNPVDYGFSEVYYVEKLELFVICTSTAGRIYYSKDGENWNYYSLGFSMNINSIVYSEKLNLFVIVGGGIAISSDLIHWTKIDTTDYPGLADVCYNDDENIFLAVGAGGFIATSSDGITWATEVISEYNLLSCIYAKKIKTFMIGPNNARLYTNKTSDMSTWETTVISGFGYIRDVCYSDELGICILVGTNSGACKMSSDLVNWTQFNVGLNISQFKVYYFKDKNLFMIMSSNSYISIAQLQLQKNNLVNIGISFSDIIEIEDKLIGVAGGGNVSTSEDGWNWLKQTTGTSYALKSITYKRGPNENELFLVAVGYSGTIITSIDSGITWDVQTSGVSKNLNGVCYSETLGLFVAVGTNGIILTSIDGINWSSQEYPISVELMSVCYSESLNLFVAVAYNGGILTSSDGITWNYSNPVGDLHFIKVIWSEEKKLFMAITTGTNGYAVRSSDGINWIKIQVMESDVSSPRQFNNINFCKDIFIITGNGGEVQTSPDGINWTLQRIDSSLYVHSLGKAIYFSKVDKTFIYGADNYVLDFEKNINIIDKLTQDSDINFNLDVGENIVKVLNVSQVFDTKLTYRQKYVGV